MARRRPRIDERIAALVEQFTPRIRDAFLAAMQDVTDAAVLADIVKALEAGDYIGPFRAVGFSEAAMRPVTAMIEEAFEAGGVMTTSSFPKRLNTPTGKFVARFDVRASRAEAIIRDQSAKLVTRVGEDVKANIRAVALEGMTAGRNPRAVALDLIGRIDPTTGRRVGGIIGLTPEQAQWVVNARKDLEELNPRYFTRQARDKRFDKQFAKSIADGKPLSSEQISKITGKYSDNLLKTRGEAIAITEAHEALNKAQFEAINQASDIGAVAAARKVWDSTGEDGRTRPDHLAMEGQSVGLNEPFTAPDGSKMMYPGDTSLGAKAKQTIRCRCRFRLAVDWLSDLD